MFTSYAAGSAQGCPWQANKVYSGTSVEKAIGNVHGGDGNSVSVTKFLSLFGLESNNPWFRWKLKWFKEQDSGFIDTFGTGFWSCCICLKKVQITCVRSFRLWMGQYSKLLFRFTTCCRQSRCCRLQKFRLVGYLRVPLFDPCALVFPDWSVVVSWLGGKKFGQVMQAPYLCDHLSACCYSTADVSRFGNPADRGSSCWNFVSRLTLFVCGTSGANIF